MILKGNIRASGQELAKHLMNDRSNDDVELGELRGFASDDLAGAFREIEGVAAGTNCTKPIYSLSINPSQPMTREDYGQAIERIEQKLGLTDQARAVVFHVKDGREHCHVAWSRIDLERMQARHMEFDRQKLREVARELVREFGHEMPDFLGKDRGNDRYKDRFKEATLAERGQEQRTGINPAERRAEITDAYHQSDSPAAFRSALRERGYELAKGDKRGFVLVDRAAEVHNLTRQIEGAKAKEIRDTLRLDQLQDLPTVQQAKERIAERARNDMAKRAPERPQESKEPIHTARGAEEALKVVRDAQRADMKAQAGEYREALAAIRDQERKKVNDARAAIKDAYRDDWRDLFTRQREEMKAATDLAKSPARRLQWLLEHDNMDKQQDGARGYLAAAFRFMTGAPKERTASLRRQHFTEEARTDHKAMFRFVAKGELDFKKLERTHQQERAELADLQKAATREEIRAIRQDTRDHRAEAKERHEAAIEGIWDRYTDPIHEAYRRRDIARDGNNLTPNLEGLEQTFSPFARWGDLTDILTADPAKTPLERDTERPESHSYDVHDRQPADRTPEAKRDDDLAGERLEASKRIIEDQGRDASQGEKAEREGRTGFGFQRQGFKEQGLGFGRSGREDDDDERPFKPPTQAFNP